MLHTVFDILRIAYYCAFAIFVLVLIIFWLTPRSFWTRREQKREEALRQKSLTGPFFDGRGRMWGYTYYVNGRSIYIDCEIGKSALFIYRKNLKWSDDGTPLTPEESDAIYEKLTKFLDRKGIEWVFEEVKLDNRRRQLPRQAPRA
jgi:hypothetical protein